MNNYMYGTECSICHAINPDGRYLPHEGRFYFCGKHTAQEVSDWQSKPAGGAAVPTICDGCGAGPMLDRGGFYDCFAPAAKCQSDTFDVIGGMAVCQGWVFKGPVRAENATVCRYRAPAREFLAAIGKTPDAGEERVVRCGEDNVCLSHFQGLRCQWKLPHPNVNHRAWTKDKGWTIWADFGETLHHFDAREEKEK